MDARVVEVDSLPFGQKVVWHQDLNIVSVLRGLCPEERDATIDELQAEWRARLRLVPEPA